MFTHHFLKSIKEQFFWKKREREGGEEGREDKRKEGGKEAEKKIPPHLLGWWLNSKSWAKWADKSWNQSRIFLFTAVEGVVLSNIFTFSFVIISICLVTAPLLEAETEVRGNAKGKDHFTVIKRLKQWLLFPCSSWWSPMPGKDS